MRARAMNTVAGESRLMDTEELRAYTNLGRNNAMKLGEEIGAKVKIGIETTHQCRERRQPWSLQIRKLPE